MLNLLSLSLQTVNGKDVFDDCLKSGKPTSVIYREFYASDLSAPASAPIKMTLRGGSAEGITVGIEAGYFDLLNVGWPRFRYTPELAPGIKYFE